MAVGEKAFIRKSRDASSRDRNEANATIRFVYGHPSRRIRGVETGSTWKAKRHGARGRRKIEGTRLNVGQRRKLRRKACPVAMGSIRPEDVESPSLSNLHEWVSKRRTYFIKFIGVKFIHRTAPLARLFIQLIKRNIIDSTS